MFRTTDDRSNFEALESRLALSIAGPEVFESVFPEGFSSTRINEYVPMTNTNDFAVSWELIARYEFGERDQTLGTGTLAANTRGGVTISDVLRPQDMLVRPNVPYALVLRASAPLAATLSHYDFGSSIGETFTTQRNEEWTFGDGLKNNAVSRDYFLVYNPQAVTAMVTITLFFEDGSRFNQDIFVSPFRRAGWSIANLTVPDGVFSTRILSDIPIVASHSHYDIAQGRGYGELGSPGGGRPAGVISTIDNDDGFYEINGDERNGIRFDAQSYLSILNTGSLAASVTLNFILDEAGDPPPIVRTINAEPGRTTFTVDNLDLPIGDEFGVVYESDRSVTITGSVYQGRDATGQTAVGVAATEWSFGEGFMSRNRAGGQVIEDLYIFNPDNESTTVTIELVFNDGSVITINRGVDDREFEDVEMHNLEELLARPASMNWYGIRVTSPTPVVVTFEHWDGALGGGFQTAGLAGGTIVLLADVLDL
ncbi:hypothetical protein PHYC_01859 [Phycisphaerales bacterium]|nr:hypothetical protein PHYC_01859 [Phycisphaerales bacterium]